MSREARHDAVVRTQTLVSVAVYAFIPTALLWLFRVPGPATVFGERSLIGPALAPALLGTFMMTIGLTLMIRAQVRRATMPALVWAAADRDAARRLPRSLLARAAVLALGATVVFVPAALALVGVAGVLPLSREGFAVFNIVYGACIGAVVTRYVVLAALAD